MKIEKMNIAERTNLMYKILRKVDNFNRNFRFETDYLLIGFTYLFSLFNELINGLNGEILVLKNTNKLRKRETELTREIEMLLDSSKFMFLYDFLRSQDNKYSKELIKILDKLLRKEEKLIKMRNSIFDFEDVSFGKSINLDDY